MNTRLKEVGIPYPEFTDCGANSLLENQVTTPYDLSQLLPWVATPHLHTISLWYSSVFPKVMSLNSVAVVINLGTR